MSIQAKESKIVKKKLILTFFSDLRDITFLLVLPNVKRGQEQLCKYFSLPGMKKLK